MDTLYIILLISILGPVIGSLIGVIRKPSENMMYDMLAFAAGVMIAISFMELIPESIKMSSIAIAAMGITIGGLTMFLVDILTPHMHANLCRHEHGQTHLKRTAIYLLIGIFLHNFPEGMAIATGTVIDFKLTLAIALAIAIHDIPEGICTSAPYYYCTKKRLKSFLLSASTAIPTIIGFLLAKILYQYISLATVGLIIAATAGLMIYISADELIPTSCNKGAHGWTHSTIFSLMAGVISVVLLGAI